MTQSTLLAYLSDTYKLSGKATLLEAGKDERGIYIVLDETIFYPQGGGQASDTGFVDVGEVRLLVFHTGFHAGKVHHYVDAVAEVIESLRDQHCELTVDRERRLRNGALHTAGHLIAGVVESIDGGLKAVRGHHFDGEAFVEFEGEVIADRELVLSQCQEEVDCFTEQGGSVAAELVSFEELQQRCSNVPVGLPKDKPLRIVTIEGFDPLPCGGTHVASLAEVGGIELRKIKTKRGKTKISYGLHEAGMRPEKE